MPLNQLFVLNLPGYVVLLLIFWFVAPRLGDWAWVVDVVFILYVALILGAWLSIGGPNPQGLGYVSKILETLLILPVGSPVDAGRQNEDKERRCYLTPSSQGSAFSKLAPEPLRCTARASTNSTPSCR